MKGSVPSGRGCNDSWFSTLFTGYYRNKKMRMNPEGIPLGAVLK
jgi:hypothetical protein